MVGSNGLPVSERELYQKAIAEAEVFDYVVYSEQFFQPVIDLMLERYAGCIGNQRGSNFFFAVFVQKIENKFSFVSKKIYSVKISWI